MEEQEMAELFGEDDNDNSPPEAAPDAELQSQDNALVGGGQDPEDNSAPDMTPTAVVPHSLSSRRAIVPSLRQACINTLVIYRDYLGDVGYIDPDAVRSILSSCSWEQLRDVEDATLEGSGRELSWYTWHLWHRHYQQDYQSMPRRYAKVPCLPGQAPEDYVHPVGISAEQGDWRACLLVRRHEEEQRAALVRGKLRDAYEADQARKDAKRTAATSKLPPPRRSRGTAAPLRLPMAAPNKSSLLSQPDGAKKFLSGLGLVGTSRTTMTKTSITTTSAALKNGVRVVTKRTTYLGPPPTAGVGSMQRSGSSAHTQAPSALASNPNHSFMHSSNPHSRPSPSPAPAQHWSASKAAASTLQTHASSSSSSSSSQGTSSARAAALAAMRQQQQTGGNQGQASIGGAAGKRQAECEVDRGPDLGASKQPRVEVKRSPPLPAKPQASTGQRLGLSGYAKLQGSNGYAPAKSPVVVAGKGGMDVASAPRRPKLMALDEL